MFFATGSCFARKMGGIQVKTYYSRSFNELHRKKNRDMVYQHIMSALQIDADAEDKLYALRLCIHKVQEASKNGIV